jgi:hypothetical protein
LTGFWLISYVALWVLFFVLAAIVFSVLRNLGLVYGTLKLALPQLRHAPSDLKAGQLLPDVTWHTMAGERMELSHLRGVTQAFVLVSPSCETCVKYLRQLATEHPEVIDPIGAKVERRLVVSIGDREDALELTAKAGLDANTVAYLDPDGLVSEKWGITSTPFTVVVDEHLRVIRQIYAGNGVGNLMRAKDIAPITHVDNAIVTAKEV